MQKALQWQTWEEWNAGRKKIIYIVKRLTSIKLTDATLTICGKETETRLPLESILRLVFIGVPHCHPALLYKMVKKGISIDILDALGKPQAVMHAATNKAVYFLDKQMEFEERPESCFALARVTVMAKIHNQISLLRRNAPSVTDLRASIRQLEQLPDKVDWSRLRGLEGQAGRYFFSQMAHLLSPFRFSGRKARPAPDPVNSMLSLGYSLLHNRIGDAIMSSGLAPQWGFFHRGRGTHWALASDLIEEWRHEVDRMVIRLIHLRQVKPEDFKIRNDTCVFANSDKFAVFLDAFETRFSSLLESPFDRPGCPAGTQVSRNEWLVAGVKSYVGHICGYGRYLPYQVSH